MTDHLEQTAVGMEVLGILLHMLGQAVDAAGEYGDLNLGGTGVTLVGCVLSNDLVFSSLRIMLFHLINYLRQDLRIGIGEAPLREHSQIPGSGHINMEL